MKQCIELTSIRLIKAYGKDIKRIRYAENLSLAVVARKMRRKGFCYYPMLLHRLERKTEAILTEPEFMALVSCLGCDFKIV